MKYFIITIDTEGDNLWEWHEGDAITTQNTLYLQRFQNICNTYGFKPVWLTNYEMISDERYVKFITDVEATNTGELGMHLHAWNTPPEYNLPIAHEGAPYLIEYPAEIMDEKIQFLTNEIENRTGIRPTTHRAGRWAMNDTYFMLLAKHGYTVDCSFTPHINWESSVGRTKNSKGSDYTKCPETPFYKTYDEKTILEVPVSVEISHRYHIPEKMNLRKFVGNAIRAYHGSPVWIRPNGKNIDQMIRFSDETLTKNRDYLMFMLHSSEMMPGGSPTFKTQESIEILYRDLERLFQHVSKNYEGITLREYCEKFESGK